MNHKILLKDFGLLVLTASILLAVPCILGMAYGLYFDSVIEMAGFFVKSSVIYLLQ